MTAEAPLVTSTTTSDNDRLLEAQDEVRDHCGWHIAPERTETLILDGSGASVQMIPSLLVSDVTAVVDDGVPIDPSCYTWRENGVLERHGGHWGCRKIAVTLRHGYDKTPRTVAKVIKRLALRAGSDPGAAQQVGQVRFAVSLTQGTALGGTLSDYDAVDLAKYTIKNRP